MHKKNTQRGIKKHVHDVCSYVIYRVSNVAKIFIIVFKSQGCSESITWQCVKVQADQAVKSAS